MTTLFITGIDTNIGKSIACGALAKCLLEQNYNVFTQKWIETGCDTISEDLQVHQAVAKKKFNNSNIEKHSPYRFSFPASPHLSAQLEDKKIDDRYLISQTKKLSNECDHLLIEGAGGLCVPISNEVLLIDLIEELKIPIVLVTSGRLGSINHTILSLELCWQRNIEVRAIIYNHFPKQDQTITNDTRSYLQKFLQRHKKQALWLELTTNATPSLCIPSSEIQQLVK